MNTNIHIISSDDNTILQQLNDFYSLISGKSEEEFQKSLNHTCDDDRKTEDNGSDKTTATDTAEQHNNTSYMKYVYDTIIICSTLFNSVCLAKLAFMN